MLPVGPQARLNDGIVDPNGGIWIGSMGLTPNPDQPLGKLWHIDAGGSIDEMLCDLGISNGIAWADESTGHHVDSLVRTVYSVSREGGSLRREPVLKFSSPVEPDGILLADGVVWIALWDGGALGRYEPATGRFCEVRVPATRPSSLAMSSELVLVTTAGRGTGSNLDLSGQVIFQPISQLDMDTRPGRPKHGLASV